MSQNMTEGTFSRGVPQMTVWLYNVTSRTQNLSLQVIVGLVLGIGLIVVIVLGIILFIWILLKLRQHEKDIAQLHDAEFGRNLRTLDKNDSSRTDSAIELSDVDIDRGRPLSQLSEISNARGVKARITLMIQKEEANIYGNTPPLGQVLMTAQDFYKEQTQTREDVPIENVQVVNKTTNKRTAVSKVLTADWKEGVPTSLLFNSSATSFEEILCQNKGIFIHRTIGPQGGKLTVSGVSITIPPGALEDEKLISIGVLWNENLAPVLTRKQCLLSPIVLCQPSGLKFKVPVTLSFPHAAVNVTRDWIPRILKREGSVLENNDWQPITLEDYEERNVNDHHISLKLRHFTLYTCAGESKPGAMAAKLVHIVAFVGRLQKGSFFKPRIYCLNRYKDDLEEVESTVKKIDLHSTMVDTTELIVHDNEQDVVVDIVKLSPDWKLTGDRTEILPFELIWHAFHPHCTFVIKPSKTTVSEVQCEIKTYQKKAEQMAAKLKIAEIIPQAQSPLNTVPENPNLDLIRELIILLDPDDNAGSAGGNWKDLAEKMGCDLARIRWLEVQKQKSPTELLLDKWIEDQRTFTELEKVMIEIHREDAAEEIRRRLTKLVCSSKK